MNICALFFHNQAYQVCR